MAPDLTLGPRLAQLAALLEGGTPTAEALDALARAERRPEARRALSAAAALPREGRPLGEALAAAGELALAREVLDGAGASTPAALARLAEFYRAREELRAASRAATLYPKLLLLSLVLLLGFLSFVVAPALEALFREQGHAMLPLGTQWLLELASFVRSWRLALLLAAAGALAVFLALRRRPSGLLARLRARLPIVGEALRQLTAAELLEALALRLSAGVAPAQAYVQAAAAVGLTGFRATLTRGVATVQAGGRIGEALLSSGTLRRAEAVLISAVEAERPEALERAARRASRALVAASRRSLAWMAPAAAVCFLGVVLLVGLALASPASTIAATIRPGV